MLPKLNVKEGLVLYWIELTIVLLLVFALNAYTLFIVLVAPVVVDEDNVDVNGVANGGWVDICCWLQKLDKRNLAVNWFVILVDALVNVNGWVAVAATAAEEEVAYDILTLRNWNGFLFTVLQSPVEVVDALATGLGRLTCEIRRFAISYALA